MVTSPDGILDRLDWFLMRQCKRDSLITMAYRRRVVDVSVVSLHENSKR